MSPPSNVVMLLRSSSKSLTKQSNTALLQRCTGLSTYSRMMAQPNATSQTISDTAKAEGGPSKGSTSAQMQSQVGKEKNFDQAIDEIGSKMQNDPESITSADANYIKSREARATGQAQPGKESISAEAQRLATANEQGSGNQSANEPNPDNRVVSEQGTSSNESAPLSPEEQSQLTRQKNFEEAISTIGHKMQTDPEHITKEDGDTMHRREQKAQGRTEKGGIASQAQKLAAENEKKGTI